MGQDGEITMRAARLHAAGDLRIEDVPEPGPVGPDEVLLRVLAAGICGSDVHNFRTGQWLSGSPRVAGHEFSASVVETGTAVAGLSPGDMVVADSRYWCGRCDACLAGRRNVCRRLGFVGEVCDGGFAAYTMLPARLVIPVAATVDPVVAAMAEPLAVALHAVRRLAPTAGEPVLVAGCGPIGGLAALLLSRLHDGPVRVSDRNRARADRVADVTGARPVELDRDPIGAHRFALDATGSTVVIDALVRSLDGGGALCLVGISHGTMAIDPNHLVEREIALIGSHAFADELPEAVAMLADLEPFLLRFVDREYGIGDVADAYGRLLSGEATGLKAIIRPV
jgi:(R,R)-butanediol dehydrogenase/meso-butanediol dehydrogenase/diacetyl reductase